MLGSDNPEVDILKRNMQRLMAENKELKKKAAVAVMSTSSHRMQPSVIGAGIGRKSAAGGSAKNAKDVLELKKENSALQEEVNKKRSEVDTLKRSLEGIQRSVEEKGKMFEALSNDVAEREMRLQLAVKKVYAKYQVKENELRVLQLQNEELQRRLFENGAGKSADKAPPAAPMASAPPVVAISASQAAALQESLSLAEHIEELVKKNEEGNDFVSTAELLQLVQNARSSAETVAAPSPSLVGRGGGGGPRSATSERERALPGSLPHAQQSSKPKTSASAKHKKTPGSSGAGEGEHILRKREDGKLEIFFTGDVVKLKKTKSSKAKDAGPDSEEDEDLEVFKEEAPGGKPQSQQQFKNYKSNFSWKKKAIVHPDDEDAVSQNTTTSKKSKKKKDLAALAKISNPKVETYAPKEEKETKRKRKEDEEGGEENANGGEKAEKTEKKPGKRGRKNQLELLESATAALQRTKDLKIDLDDKDSLEHLRLSEEEQRKASMIDFGDQPIAQYLQLRSSVAENNFHKRELLKSQLFLFCSYLPGNPSVASECVKYFCTSQGSSSSHRSDVAYLQQLDIFSQFVDEAFCKTAALLEPDSLCVDHSEHLEALSKAILSWAWLEYVQGRHIPSSAAAAAAKVPSLFMYDVMVAVLRTVPEIHQEQSASTPRRHESGGGASDHGEGGGNGSGGGGGGGEQMFHLVRQLLSIFIGCTGSEATNHTPQLRKEFLHHLNLDNSTLLSLTMRTILVDLVSQVSAETGAGGGVEVSFQHQLLPLLDRFLLQNGASSFSPKEKLCEATLARVTDMNPNLHPSAKIDAVFALRLHLLYRGFGFLEKIIEKFSSNTVENSERYFAMLLSFAVVDFRMNTQDWPMFEEFFKQSVRKDFSSFSQIFVAQAILQRYSDEESGNETESSSSALLPALEDMLLWSQQQLVLRGKVERLKAQAAANRGGGGGNESSSGGMARTMSRLQQFQCGELFESSMGRELLQTIALVKKGD